MDTLGPLTYNDNGAIVVVGVTSWRRSFDRNNKHLKSKQICKQHGTYSVFAQVAAQLQWIKEVIENPPETCKHRDEPFFDNAYIYYWILLSISEWSFQYSIFNPGEAQRKGGQNRPRLDCALLLFAIVEW